MEGIKKKVGFLLSCLSFPLPIDVFIKFFCLVVLLLPYVAFAQKPQDLMPPSLAVFVKKEARVKSTVGPPPNSYDLALKANEKLMEAQTKYTFANTKTKVLASTLSFGNSVISKLIPAPAISPIESLVSFNVNEWTEHAEAQDKQVFQTAIEKTFSEYTAAYLQNKPDASQAELSQHFSKFVKADLISTEDYPLVGKKIDVFLLDYVAKNEKRFDELQKVVKNKLHVQPGDNGSFDQKLNKIKEELKTENDLAFAKLEKKNWEKLVEYQKSFDKLQNNVIDNYKAVYKDIDEMKTEITKNTAQIVINNRAIKNLEAKVQIVGDDVEQVKKATYELNIKTQQNRKLIYENAYKTNVIADVLYDNVDVKSKLKLIETGVVKVADADKEKKRLQRIEKIDSAQRYFEIGSQTVQLAQNLGLSDKDAERMGSVIKALSATAKIAKAYETGDVLAGIEGINMGFEVFRHKKPKPNPELEAIMAEFAKMNKKLDVIDEKVDNLSNKLTKMMELQVALHQETTEQLGQIKIQLDKIDKKIDYIINLATANGINGMTEAFWTEIKIKTDTCRSLGGLHNNIKGIDRFHLLLGALDNIVGDTANRQKPFLHYNSIDRGLHTQLDLYNPQLEILDKIRNGKNDNSSAFYPSLTMLAAKCGTTNDIYNEFSSSKYAKKDRLILENIDLERL